MRPTVSGRSPPEAVHRPDATDGFVRVTRDPVGERCRSILEAENPRPEGEGKLRPLAADRAQQEAGRVRWAPVLLQLAPLDGPPLPLEPRERHRKARSSLVQALRFELHRRRTELRPHPQSEQRGQCAVTGRGQQLRNRAGSAEDPRLRREADRPLVSAPGGAQRGHETLERSSIGSGQGRLGTGALDSAAQVAKRERTLHRLQAHEDAAAHEQLGDRMRGVIQRQVGAVNLRARLTGEADEGETDECASGSG
jgi:hypothetical protein